MIVRYFFFFIILTFYACSSNENVLLELALDNSGENRSELEAVKIIIRIIRRNRKLPAF